MADEVRLWRYERDERDGTRYLGEWNRDEKRPEYLPLVRRYIARPVAHDEAREERLKELRDWLAGANADLAYIDKAVVAAGYRFSTTEAQPEHVVEVAMFLASLKRDRDEWMARAEKAEAQRDAFINGREMQRARAERAEAATREADARANTARIAAELMRAKAERAEAERDELRARLDAARGGAS